MPVNQRVRAWRNLRTHGLELVHIDVSSDLVQVSGDLLDPGANPFAASYDWVLDGKWETRALKLRVRARKAFSLEIERTGKSSWRVDGEERADLAGCDEIDLSATPFCNTLALRRFGPPPGGSGELTALYVELPDASIRRSRQRYQQLGPREFLYIDFGVYAGFRAKLTVDADGLIVNYEGLFERMENAA